MKIYSLIFSLFLFLLPILLGLACGIYYLFQIGGILTWAFILLICWLTAWRVLAYATRPITKIAFDQPTLPESFWDKKDCDIWIDVKNYANKIELGEISSSSKEDLLSILNHLALNISSAYNPSSADPLLEVKISELFLALEFASQDLRELVLKQIPFEDSITINNIFVARKGYKLAKQAHTFYRFLRPVANPGAAIISEIREFLAKKAVSEVSKNTWCFLNARMTEHVAKHLINLYSGKVSLKNFTAPSSETDKKKMLKQLIKAAFRFPQVARRRRVRALPPVTPE